MPDSTNPSTAPTNQGPRPPQPPLSPSANADGVANSPSATGLGGGQVSSAFKTVAPPDNLPLANPLHHPLRQLADGGADGGSSATPTVKPIAPTLSPFTPNPSALPIKQVSTQAPPATSSNPVSSSIRTMTSDLQAIKNGQTPAGAKIEIKPPSPPTSNQPTSLPSSPSSAVQIGKAVPSPNITAKPVMPPPPPSVFNKNSSSPSSGSPVTLAPSKSGTTFTIPELTKPLAPPPNPPPPVGGLGGGGLANRPTATLPPAISVPSPTTGRSNNIALYVIIGFVVLIVGGIITWLLINRQALTLTPSPTSSGSPALSPSTTATPAPSLATLFESPEVQTIPSTGDALKIYSDLLKNQTLAGNKFKVFRIVDENNVTYTLPDFLTHFSTTKLASSSFFGTNPWLLGIYGQSLTANVNDVTQIKDVSELLNKNQAVKKAFIVVELNDPVTVKTIIESWEPHLVKDFAKLFGYATPRNTTLVSDFYNGIAFKYLPIPDRNTGLAYTITNKFLLFASSRDSFRAVIDKLQLQR